MNVSAPGLANSRTLRPSERVADYLRRELARENLGERIRLPSNRELARELKVSVPTVQTVLKNLARQGLVEARHGNGTYLVCGRVKSSAPLRIVVASLLDDDRAIKNRWVQSVVSGLMPVALQTQPTTFVGISAEKYGTDSSVTALVAEMPKADGLIIVPYALMPEDRERVTAAYEGAGKPVVHLTPPALSATTNFVAPDYFQSAHRLARSWRQTGRKRIALLSLTGEYEYLVSCRMRLMGLASGLDTALGHSVQLEVLSLQSDQTEEVRSYMKEVFSRPETKPDGLLVSSPVEIDGVLAAARDCRIKIPESLSLVCVEQISPRPEVTAIEEPTLPMSRSLMQLLTERIRQKGAPLPAIYLASKFNCRHTTRPEENELLAERS